MSVPAAAADLKPLVDALGKGGYEDTVKHVGELAATGDPAAAPVLDALAAGDLYVRKADGAVVIARKAGDGFALTDPVTTADAGSVPADQLDKIKINNKLRGVIRAALGSLTLMSPECGDPPGGGRGGLQERRCQRHRAPRQVPRSRKGCRRSRG